MGLKVISANYFDRNASDRWLVRPAHVEPDKEDPRIKTAPVAVATDVLFIPSNEREDGFGCSIVGVSAKVETELTRLHLHEMERAIPIHFNFDSFVDENGEVVSYCEKVYLSDDGTMRAILPVKERAETA